MAVQKCTPHFGQDTTMLSAAGGNWMNQRCYSLALIFALGAAGGKGQPCAVHARSEFGGGTDGGYKPTDGVDLKGRFRLIRPAAKPYSANEHGTQKQGPLCLN